MDMVDTNSICYWFDQREKTSCGYCKGTSGSVQDGMWAENLKAEDYQLLIDRGWRRSGQYCYKPVLKESCCPLYTIRCASCNFYPSNSQKKVMKKVNRFLKTGILKKRDAEVRSESEFDERAMVNYREFAVREFDLEDVTGLGTDWDSPQVVSNDVSFSESNSFKTGGPKEIAHGAACSSQQCDKSSKSRPVEKGMGADPNKPPCKKAKIMRLEKRMKKLENSGNIKASSNPQQPKTLEQFMTEVSSEDSHKLVTKLIEPSNPSSEWKKYEEVEFSLFKKYQSVIHNDPPHKNDLEGFLRFLVHSPMKWKKPSGSSTSSDGPAYGSYHQQYWLDDKLIAVGVIDILPKCVSAVYFFYDPDYRELTLGTYGALKEIQLARELYPVLDTEFYYMGYYIHSCQKMRYKGNMAPSFLLCPESYQWFPIQKCLEKLDKEKYCRFNEAPTATDDDECTVDDIDRIRILFKRTFMLYKKYKKYRDRAEVYAKIGKLVGKNCIKSLVFLESD